MEISDTIVDQFRETAEERDDDPQNVIEQLMLEYIRGNDISAQLTQIHDQLEELARDSSPATEKSTAVEGSSESDEVADSLVDYDPKDDKKIAKKALEDITDVPDENIEIDPDDLGDVPGSIPIKQAVVIAACRYRYDHLWQYQLRDVASEVIPGGIGPSAHKQKHYVRQVWDRLIENGFDFERRFTSVDAALDYLDEISTSDDVDMREDKVDQVSLTLAAEYEVDPATLNTFRQRLGLEPIE